MDSGTGVRLQAAGIIPLWGLGVYCALPIRFRCSPGGLVVRVGRHGGFLSAAGAGAPGDLVGSGGSGLQSGLGATGAALVVAAR